VKKKLKKFCSCETYYDIRSINLKNTAMKKQEMIDFIIQEEKRLWDAVQRSMDILGIDDEVTQSAVTRWAVMNDLKTKLQIK
jgi:hypothetical protein